jgi:hypothetical protein
MSDESEHNPVRFGDQGTGKPLDPERLAALIDGRLSEAERSELLASINESDEAFDILVEASAIAPAAVAPLQLERTDAPTQSSTAAKPRRTSRWLAVAAGIAGIALVPWGWNAIQGGRAADLSRFASALAPMPQQFETAISSRPWSDNRGPSLRAGARAARVGVYVTDIELASRLSGGPNATLTPLATRLITDLIALLEASPNGGAAAQAYKAVRDNPSDTLREARARNARAGALAVDPPNVELGAWTEAALVAATARDSSFFATREATDFLARTAASADATEGARNAARDVQAAKTAAPIQWPELEDRVRRLLKEITE